jgi:poly(hydroxyalkanoate) depolymerase family esterase
MRSKFATAMRRATLATRALNVLGATHIIQQALASSALSRFSRRWRPSPVPERQEPVPKAQKRVRAKSASPPDVIPHEKSEIPKASDAVEKRARAPKRLRRPLGEVIETLRLAHGTPPLSIKMQAMSSGSHAKTTALPMPAGALYVSRTFTSKAGKREFKLYIPSSAPEKPSGLIVMLHGCTQSPDDFAAGTNMNAIAETHGLLIAYPAQTRASNASSCWNWFEQGHQLRDAGEPAILSGLTRKLVAEFGIDADQVFVAGLSAGGAMAVIMGKTHPDLFRAVGVHSGLAYQSAGNVMSALAVMRGSAGARHFGKGHIQTEESQPVRTIVFHGAADRTVHPSNAQRISEMAHAPGQHELPKVSSGTKNGRRFKRTLISAKSGKPMVESWLIDGTGHAWSGGKPSGSYTDPQGPDASAEMVRFFLDKK